MLASIPSPSSGVVHLGPLPLRAYAGFILLGAVLAVYFGDKRWVARGGRKGLIADMAATAVPAGLVGSRIYHVLTSRQDFYFHHPVEILKIWEGGLGIWGGIAGGAVGAWWVLRKQGISFLPVADAVAPFLALAQAVGRVGNYFNQELYGKPTKLPWALEIDADHAPDGKAGTYHPTFLYELIWDLGVMGLVLWADNRWKLGKGRAFALYVAAYCAGRFWIEALRIDDAHMLFGIRLNDFTSVILFVGAVSYLVVRRGAGPDEVPHQETAEAQA
ncbi:MAG: prolipoprotein diacylglyceryl transferase [Frankiales bacterium]|nr:prolipoprotein diacylglyceryl transferase [Frankiales bacterium]